jgi:hypothetical protein
MPQSLKDEEVGEAQRQLASTMAALQRLEAGHQKVRLVDIQQLPAGLVAAPARTSANKGLGF